MHFRILNIGDYFKIKLAANQQTSVACKTPRHSHYNQLKQYDPEWTHVAVIIRDIEPFSSMLFMNGKIQRVDTHGNGIRPDTCEDFVHLNEGGLDIGFSMANILVFNGIKPASLMWELYNDDM